jgi:hypothetical protein
MNSQTFSYKLANTWTMVAVEALAQGHEEDARAALRIAQNIRKRLHRAYIGKHRIARLGGVAR